MVHTKKDRQLPQKQQKGSSQTELIFTDPFIVIGFLEKALENLKNPVARMEAAISCIELRNGIWWNEFGKHVDETDLKPASSEHRILTASDPLIILDHLERSIGYLVMPGARIQAWLTCMGIRSTIMWREYKKDKPQWAYKVGVGRS